MAVDPYIARGITPLGEGLPELLLQMRGQQQRGDIANRSLDLDQQGLGLRQQGLDMQRQQMQGESDTAQFQQEAQMAYAMLKSGDPSYAIRKMAESNPQFAQLAQQDPQKAAEAARVALEQHLGAGVDENTQAKIAADNQQQAAQFKQQQQMAGMNAGYDAQNDARENQYRLGQISATGEQSRQTDAAKPKTATTGVPTEGERVSANYLGRMDAAEKLLGDYKPGIKDYMAARTVMQGGPLTSGVANKALSAEGQKYYQAATDWVRAKLRKESGAVISPQEMEQEIKTYFPVPGDTKDTIAQKKASRGQATLGMRQMGGRAVTSDAAPSSNEVDWNSL